MKNFQYCAAIRTLGTAGEKYRQTLLSLQQQTIPPKKILVYIAEGYPIPKEAIGIEQYIYCPKGMVSQRSLPFNEIDTEWILFLDDDIFIPHDGVEKLFSALEQFKGDCISPNTFSNHALSFKNKIKAALSSQTFPHWDKLWAFKIRNSGHTLTTMPLTLSCPHKARLLHVYCAEKKHTKISISKMNDGSTTSNMLLEMTSYFITNYISLDIKRLYITIAESFI